MNTEIIKQYKVQLYETWSAYIEYRTLRALKEKARHVNIGGASTDYDAAAKELQDELKFNKSDYKDAGKDKVVWLVGHMNIQWPTNIPGFDDVKGISAVMSNDFYNHVHRLRDKIVTDYLPRGSNSTVIWDSLIKDTHHKWLSEIEEKVSSKIITWKQGKYLIQCAAFCQLLYDMKYFVKGSTNRKSVNDFAIDRYGVNIDVQLTTGKKTDREKHKLLLQKFFH